ncbi:RmlC-like cupin domain-containing protein [Talaromyces proteolyticus]|uniref:RmlC-like cupin domain-containing protein n=1 Tax=Talaromyces proteolyticus TaxID=1131652 RepID=A0AAD4L4H3_9EURO|nr:RmlC-like cupin domain-containing protein [Talaromyces proteolyticus]KAH8704851.1 RmlC-like cupin domain-containing protein [Talaromyces proteolyticus]
MTPIPGLFNSFLLKLGILALTAPAQLYALPTNPRFSDWAGSAGDNESNGGAPLRGAVVSSYKLAPGQDADADLGIPFRWDDTKNPQPIRGTWGATDPGPQTYEYSKLNPDIVAPPSTDHNSMPNAKWPMELSHNRLVPNGAGWSRQENTENLPIATAMAGVDMLLAPGAYRELHWHKASEWAYVLNGSCRVQAMDENGQTYVDDVQAGDVWFFPPGVPHSLQALDEGSEFLLVFDQGDFDDSGTGLISEMFLRTPKEVLSKNLNAPLSDFDQLPKDELYIFNGTPAPANLTAQNVTGPGGVARGNHSYTYHLSKQSAYEVPGGSIKIIDPQSFPLASTFSVALVTIHPGAMREIHWHSTDEWGFFVSGQGRVTAYSPPTTGGTFDFQAGDVSYVPATYSHYIENTGDEDIVFLEVLQAPEFTDISVGQWLKLVPEQIIKDTLHLPQSLLDNLSPNKQYIVQGNTNLTALAGGSGTA